MPIAFSIPQTLSIDGELTLSGVFVAPTGTNRLQVGSDFTLNLNDSGNLRDAIQTAAGVLSLNSATGAVTLATAPGNAGYVRASTSGTTIYVSGAPTPSLAGILLDGGANFSGTAAGGAHVYTASASETLTVFGNVDTRTAADAGTYSLGGTSVLSAASITTLLLNNGGFTNVDIPNGNVGIGTAGTPTERLHVTGGNLRVEQNTYVMSGLFFRDSGNYTRSGAASVAQIFAVSGEIVGTVAATYATIANLGSTGQNLYNLVTNLSGQADTNYATVTNLRTTGQSLYNLVTNFSGQANTNYATVTNLGLTGQQAWTTADANARNISGILGIGTTRPSGVFHVNGEIVLSGMPTSTSANVGGADLPANPVGFITLNITGGNFKIPYYNV